MNQRTRRRSNPQPSFYWYDLETTGTNSRWDRIVQYACQRTDTDLRPIGDPYDQLVRPPPEAPMQPEAARITGISPRTLEREGIQEWELFFEVSEHFQTPNTCIVGYNNVDFDDEFLRFGMYRNLRPPYEHESRRNNSRMDIFRVAQLTCALRPEGIDWPTVDDQPTYELSAIAAANNVDATGAHDASSDVQMTIQIARLIKTAQPRLWNWVCSLRNRRAAEQVVSLSSSKPLLHVSGMYSKERYCIAPVLPVVQHPSNPRRVIAVDLCGDLDLILGRSAEQIRSELFRKRQEGEPKSPRPGIHTIILNRAPMIAPLSTLNDQAARRLKIDRDVVHSAAERLQRHSDLPKVLREVHEQRIEDQGSEQRAEREAEEALYDGFLPDEDASNCRRFWVSQQRSGRWLSPNFLDSRLRDLVQRLKARIAPEQMNDQELREYHEFVRRQLTQREQTLTSMKTQARELLTKSIDEDEQRVLRELEAHYEQLSQSYEI